MFPEQLLHAQPAYSGDLPADNQNLRGQAVRLYLAALAAGRFSRWFRLNAKKLHDLSQLGALVSITTRHFDGIRPVPIDRITGSEGRAADFDGRFHPTRDRNRSRWIGIAAARLADQGLPAVSLIQIGEDYFVRDGHHRISVARALGEKFIDAEVVVWEVEAREKGERGYCLPGLKGALGQCA